MNATPGDADIGLEELPDVAESSSDTAPTLPSNQTSLIPTSDSPVLLANTTNAALPFMNPFCIIEGVQNACLPLALRVMSPVQALTKIKPPSPSDFWELAKKSGNGLQNYVHCLLAVFATHFRSTRFTEITFAMDHIVSATATFRNSIKGALDAHHITLDTFTKELEGIFTVMVNKLGNIPLPDQAPSHAERAEMVDRVLDDTEQALIQLATRYGIKEEVVTTYLFALKPQVHLLTVAIGDINEQYPQLLSTLTFSVAVMLIPESWILGPFLSIFGFGPAGPVKGSAAAWMQRYFWGGAVQAGSWFSWLQAAGMGGVPKYVGVITKAPLLVGRLAMLLPRPYRR